MIATALESAGETRLAPDSADHSTKQARNAQASSAEAAAVHEKASEDGKQVWRTSFLRLIATPTSATWMRIAAKPKPRARDRA